MLGIGVGMDKGMGMGMGLICVLFRERRRLNRRRNWRNRRLRMNGKSSGIVSSRSSFFLQFIIGPGMPACMRIGMGMGMAHGHMTAHEHAIAL